MDLGHKTKIFGGWDDDIHNIFFIWKVIEFHGSSHHQPDNISTIIWIFQDPSVYVCDEKKWLDTLIY